ncbi:hypothetical protein CHLNCDRAFT_134058 [Chlorella variabilis]|uniref:Uncharacterized protein n=1 Tax=Chlorella variabilis TaxID=554065 RepID=E1ZEW7_CHLVA|nr:hypothetical protein CHLNCDRAFT_134058 [Chlorella variabilis]EFN55571.1 hypothetical protein CHLNCDRAFT_134058 [Chlorella variabilis]|eukprot:XP_005847673.1 hypothetical protein CHLNCDRAFT_134058 [Chlorella variabilis]
MPELSPEQRVHAFLYGTPEFDGAYRHWDHQVLPHWTKAVNQQHPTVGTRFRPPRELHSPFYPLVGPYSSSDPATVRRQLLELKAAGVGVVAASWWGPSWRNGSTDSQGVSTDAALPLLLRVAEEVGVEVAFHLEPYPGRSAATTREDLAYLARRVGASPAVLRVGGLPLYYVYDSYHIPPQDWSRLLTPGGALSLRGTEADGLFIGLWLNRDDGDSQLLPGGFDGFYTYFASDAVSYGADPRNWAGLSSWAQQHGKLFIASVGPGYDDTRIRPWNAAATRPRQGGAVYRRSWDAALAVQPWAVSITSYNEWGEGTQIEPARVFGDTSGSSSSSGGGSSGGSSGSTEYETYGATAGQDEWLYLNLTLQYSQLLAQWQGRGQQQGGTPQAPGAGTHSEL